MTFPAGVDALSTFNALLQYSHMMNIKMTMQSAVMGLSFAFSICIGCMLLVFSILIFYFGLLFHILHSVL